MRKWYSCCFKRTLLSTYTTGMSLVTSTGAAGIAGSWFCTGLLGKDIPLWCRFFIKYGADVNVRPEENHIALIIAACCIQTEVAIVIPN